MYKDKFINEPIFVIKILSNFSYSDLILSISRMSQYVSSIFHKLMEKQRDTARNDIQNGHNILYNIHKKINSILTKEQLSVSQLTYIMQIMNFMHLSSLCIQ